MINKNPRNAGRKTIDNEALTETISIRFTKKELEEISKIAENINISKTRFIRNVFLVGFDDAKAFNKLGLLKGMKRLIDFKPKFLEIRALFWKKVA